MDNEARQEANRQRRDELRHARALYVFHRSFDLQRYLRSTWQYVLRVDMLGSSYFRYVRMDNFFGLVIYHWKNARLPLAKGAERVDFGPQFQIRQLCISGGSPYEVPWHNFPGCRSGNII